LPDEREEKPEKGKRKCANLPVKITYNHIAYETRARSPNAQKQE
jgi:hypothetical protein